MGKKEVTVTFKTITPLWTGNAWQQMTEIRSSSLIGSLRFWFETIMYFAGVLKKEDFNSTSRRFEKEVNRKELKNFIQKNGNNTKEIIKHLLDQQKIPVSSIIFGTTNWKSLIEIKGIEPIKDYCFGNRLNLPYAIGVKKRDYSSEEFITKDDWLKKINEYKGLKNAKREYSFFFFKDSYFYEKFRIEFLVEENLIDNVFYPLLSFMDKYGYWGGGWSIGYGRLRVESVKENNTAKENWQKLDFELPNSKCFVWDNLIEVKNDSDRDFNILKQILQVDKFHCKKERNFAEKIKNIPQEIILIESLDSNDNFKNLIQKLLVEKVKLRNCLRHICEEKKLIDSKYSSIFEKECFNRNKFLPKKEVICKDRQKEIRSLCEDIITWKNFRHKLLGELGEGSKILPFIYKEDGDLKGGLLSIGGLLNLNNKVEIHA